MQFIWGEGKIKGDITTKYLIKKVEKLQDKHVILLDIPSREELGFEEEIYKALRG